MTVQLEKDSTSMVCLQGEILFLLKNACQHLLTFRIPLDRKDQTKDVCP